MKKIIYVFSIALVSIAFFSCEQEDISPEVEIVDEGYTEERGGEEDGGVKGKPAK